MEPILIENQMPAQWLEIWLYFGSQQNPDGWRGYWTGTEFKRSVRGTDVAQPNVWGWRMTSEDDPVDGGKKGL